jgi:hypothetical protein
VRKGNTLRITSGSTMRVGYAENESDYSFTEIFLEEDAKLFVEEASSLLSYGTCRIIMKEDCELTV